eukprot:CAMPEP_0175073856 /NCGR_PEP_ID=MMETSP0052_2-20121109/20863_1 /TAXON_ID=51329 ORGANISM="Polytomella parva, Strain SAG 63-3" /NCGR_SAMPLE_ID=MMETSP0052_2 /ASSEMBLY_ACC=CAM_ASM_000194 /LENGTH=356 /DNA_ID=CAMNT_0016341849 /DNA_START=54 /DNA_END=1124 /DNA_ORIENTATION=+
MTWGEQNTEEEAWEQLDYALSKGVNFIDTAELYPVPSTPCNSVRTETYIGNWLKARNCRDKMVIATKVSGPIHASFDRTYIVANRTDPPADFAQQPQLDAASIRSAVEGSLRRLQTSYIDVYQIHWPSRQLPKFGQRRYVPRPGAEAADGQADPIPLEEQVRAMGELIQEGKIRAWGVSNETTFGVCQLHEVARQLGVPPPISIQNDFSLLFRFYEEELAEAAAPRHLNMGLLAYGSLAGGVLSGKYLPGSTTPDVEEKRSRHSKFPQFQTRYHTPRALAATAKYAEIAELKGMTPTTLSYAWAASRWFMGSVIVGATSMQQLKENLEAFEVELDEETLRAIDDVHVTLRNPNASD